MASVGLVLSLHAPFLLREEGEGATDASLSRFPPPGVGRCSLFQQRPFSPSRLSSLGLEVDEGEGAHDDFAVRNNRSFKTKCALTSSNQIVLGKFWKEIEDHAHMASAR